MERAVGAVHIRCFGPCRCAFNLVATKCFRNIKSIQALLFCLFLFLSLFLHLLLCTFLSLVSQKQPILVKNNVSFNRPASIRDALRNLILIKTLAPEVMKETKSTPTKMCPFTSFGSTWQVPFCSLTDPRERSMTEMRFLFGPVH